MGKNQAHEARKRTMGGGGGGGDGGDAPPSMDHSGVDVSYHTPEWHAARVAALTAERMTWDEFKKKAAEKESLAGGEEEAMRMMMCGGWGLSTICVYVLHACS